MQRHFTKVYTKARKPLSVRFCEVFDCLDEIIIQDVRFALKGETTEQTDSFGQPQQKAHQK